MNASASRPWIVVLTWNSRDRLSISLGALAVLQGDFEVLVVDNGSTDGSPGETRRLLPRAHLLENGSNLGFAEGNNRGLAFALERGATHVALLNDDMAVHPDWLRHLLRDAQEHPEAGIWGGLVLFRDRPHVVNSTGIVIDAWMRARDRDFGRAMSDLPPLGPESVLAVTGGAMLISREVLCGVGTLDSSLFAYYEDYDLCLRARSRGFDVRFVPQAISYHQFAASLGEQHPLRRYLLSRNQMIMIGRHGRLRESLTLLPAVALARLLFLSPRFLLRGRTALCLAEARAAVHGLARGWREMMIRRERSMTRGMRFPTPREKGDTAPVAAEKRQGPGNNAPTGEVTRGNGS